MATFVLLSKVSTEGARQVKSLAQMDEEFQRQLEERFPEVRRIASYALLGAYDFLHIFEAPDSNTAAKVALLANSFGVSTTQTMTAIPFEEFREMLKEI
ncbi:MAG: GYD domain-containing protein [Chloroflexi bacterium]|nr:MAG: GYD domain-containing protein [Chloroflexota bacterium]